MLSFGFLLLPMVVAFEQELNINNYVVKIEDNTLKSITAIGKSTNELDFANLNLQYINKHAFDHLNNVTTLNLSKTSLHRIFWLSSFGFLLFPMALATQRELNINNYIIKMADDTMKSITATGKSTNELDLSKLYLRYINEHVFDHLSNIKILNLSRNFLHQFPEHTFVNLTNLDHLDLANNRIWSLKNVFVGLNNLKSVNVSNNNLMDLERGSFFGLSNSTKIFIDRYKVMTVSTEMFDDTSFDSDISEISRGEQSNYGEKVLQPLDKDLRVKVCIQNNIVKSLEVRMKDEILTADCRAVMIDHSANKLFLSTNGITGFERGWYRLHDFPFNEIDLNDNKIVQVTSEMLNDLSAGIKKVTLRGNMIRRLDKGIIENEYIRTLDLGYNFIREIEDGALEKMNLTGSLYLDYNELENTKFVATLPPNLKELNLKRNIITEITASFFSKLSKMRTVQVARNPIEMIQGGMFDNA